MKNQKDKKGKRGGKKSLIPSFLTKLYQILENSDYHNIIKWVENGRAFVVKNLPEFIDKVLPNYFKHNNFASFVRQLNMYDFHKTRNNNNENTFYHKLFIKGQRNLLKMIKRKINITQNNQCPDDIDFFDLNQEKDFKNLSKKNLEDIYSKVLKNLEDIKEKQNEIETRINNVKEKNEMAVNENNLLKNEFTERKNYTKNLEFLIILILELSSKTDKNFGKSQSIYSSGETSQFISSNIASLSDLVFEIDNEPLNSLSRFLSDSDKACVLKNLIENCNDSVIKSMVAKCLEKYDLKLDDIDISFSKMSKSGIKNTHSKYNTTKAPYNSKENPHKYHTDKQPHIFTDNKQQEISDNNFKYKIKLANCCDLNLNSANLSSPTSILSTSDCIFGIGNKIIQPIQQKTTSGNNNKRKKNEEQCWNYRDICNGDLNLNQKEKDTMFEEVNDVTAFLISSASMSPPRLKKYESMNQINDSNDSMLRSTSTTPINPIFFNNSYPIRSSNNNQINITSDVVRNVCNNQPKYNPETFFSFCEDNFNTNTSFINKKHN